VRFELERPAVPSSRVHRKGSETELESELEFPLFRARRVREIVRLCRNRVEWIARRVDGYCGRNARQHLDVEDVLHLRDDLAANGSANGYPACVAQVDVLLGRQVERIARDEERPVAGDAVPVHIAVRGNIDRQPAVDLQQYADFVAAQELSYNG